MIQANELRLGNWIKTPEQEEKVYDNFFDTDEGVRFINDWNISVIKPIPLTEEWLFKMGFEKMFGIDDIWFIGEVCGRHLQIVIDEDRFIARLTGRTLREVISVNDLQNLYFALTNEELTIIENDSDKDKS